MNPQRRFKFDAITLIVMLTCTAVTVSAAPLPIQVTAVPNQAAAGNANEAIILVYLANEDGTPNTTAQMPVQSQDPNGGVELKGSSWSFETISGPDTFRGRAWADQPQTRTVDLPGQLRIMQAHPFFNRQIPTDPRAGIYVFHILPRYGHRGGRKAALSWVSGEYTFRVTYRDGSNRGTALGVLTIR
jgi:hypothetical protein